MNIRLFRMSGLPALPEHYDAFKSEWKESYDNLVKQLGDFKDCDDESKENYPKLLDALEADLLKKISPRKQTRNKFRRGVGHQSKIAWRRRY